jgi:hypothetical protein
MSDTAQTGVTPSRCRGNAPLRKSRTIGYWSTLKDLQHTEEFRLGRPVLLMALIMSIAGVALFVSIADRLV